MSTLVREKMKNDVIYKNLTGTCSPPLLFIHRARVMNVPLQLARYSVFKPASDAERRMSVLGVNYLNLAMAAFPSKAQRGGFISESSVTQSAYFWLTGRAGELFIPSCRDRDRTSEFTERRHFHPALLPSQSF